MSQTLRAQRKQRKLERMTGHSKQQQCRQTYTWNLRVLVLMTSREGAVLHDLEEVLLYSLVSQHSSIQVIDFHSRPHMTLNKVGRNTFWPGYVHVEVFHCQLCVLITFLHSNTGEAGETNADTPRSDVAKDKTLKTKRMLFV